MTDISLNLEHSDLLPFLIASKQIFLWDLNNFYNKSIPNHAEFTSMERKFEKKKNSYFVGFFWLNSSNWMSLGEQHESDKN